MIKLFVKGQGILNRNDGKVQRELLRLDEHDFSVDPVHIIFDSKIRGLSQQFCGEFLKVSAYRAYEGVIPHSAVTPYDLSKEFEYGAIALGPYTFHSEEGLTTQFAIMRHGLGGALVGLRNYWHREKRRGKDYFVEIDNAFTTYDA